jgi:putative aldouronate transport system permease protein
MPISAFYRDPTKNTKAVDGLLLKGLYLVDSQIPEELEESAIIDGASTFRILISIIFPLTLPTYATIGLFYAVGHWNAWFETVIYINDIHKMPMQAILRQMVLAASSEDLTKDVTTGLTEKPPAQSVKAAAIMIATVPIVCVYPFLQKYFVKGMLTGSIKG